MPGGGLGFSTVNVTKSLKIVETEFDRRTRYLPAVVAVTLVRLSVELVPRVTSMSSLNQRIETGLWPVKATAKVAIPPAATVILVGGDVIAGGMVLTTVTATSFNAESPDWSAFCHPRTASVHEPPEVGVPDRMPRVESANPGGSGLVVE